MTMPGYSAPGTTAVSNGVDPQHWGSQDFSSDSASPLSPSMGLLLSPSSSITTQDSRNSRTPPVQTPQPDAVTKTATNGQKNSQKELNANQARASVAVACVPCRSRHLKCDGGVRCSRCRTDGVECTYIKSRRGWKGKRKSKEDSAASASAPLNGVCQRRSTVNVIL